MKKYCSLLFLFLIKLSVFAQPGSLDNTFGSGGKVITDFGTANDGSFSVIIQSDGKIIVAGRSGVYPNSDFALVRYNSDGNLDNTFGSAGKVTTDFGGFDDYGSSVALQSDGRIVVAGYSYNGSDNDFALARYDSTGNLDSTFGIGGIVTTDIGGRNDNAYSVAIKDNGKIVLFGRSNNGTNNDFALVQHNSDGSLDNTFGSGGKVTTVIGIGHDIGWSMTIQGDGKIIVGGSHCNVCAVDLNYDFALVRYDSVGILDSTFGTGGIVTTDLGGDWDSASSIVIQSDGKIVVSGSSTCNGTNNDFALVRYNNNGSLDNSFGFGGKVTTDFGGFDDYGSSVALQNDGRIVVAGLSGIYPNDDFAIVRYNTDGSLDNTFGSSGIAITDFGSVDVGRSVAIQGNGKIVVAGYSINSSNMDFAVARYNGGGSVGIAENTNGDNVIIFPNPSSGIFTIDLKNKSSDTKICIYDVLGNCVLDKLSVKNSSQEIDLSNQSKGIYFMEIVSDPSSQGYEGRSGERIVKKIILN